MTQLKQHRPQINWFSPLRPAKTAIANYTAQIAPALNENLSVTFWSDRKGWDESIEQFGRVRLYAADRVRDTDLPAAEANIFNIGNDPRFHAEIYKLCRRFSGIVILHDLAIPGLLKAMARLDRQSRQSYREMLKDRGNSGEDRHLTSSEPVLERAVGIMVHTQRGRDLLRARKLCPVAFHPLPFPASEPEPIRAPPATYKRLIIFGFLGSNRRLDSVLRALQTYEHKSELRLDIYGEVQQRRQLERSIRRYKLRDIVNVHGFVPTAELAQALSQADLALNLRHPTMGEASRSLLASWNYSVPVLVTRSGAYLDLPEGSVEYVNVESETEDLHRHFDRLRRQPGYFRKIGERGREELLSKHRPESYARALANLIEKAQHFAETKISKTQTKAI